MAGITVGVKLTDCSLGRGAMGCIACGGEGPPCMSCDIALRPMRPPELLSCAWG